MAYEFQVTVDCADPHMLAGWWAETLSWQVPEAKAVKNRLHLDVRIGADDVEHAVADLTARGEGPAQRPARSPHLGHAR